MTTARATRCTRASLHAVRARVIAAAALALVVTAAAGVARAAGTADSAGSADAAGTAGAAGSASAAAASAAIAAPSPGAEPRDVEPRAPRAPSVTIKLIVDPPSKTTKPHVFWGLKDLGVAPLEMQRPRGSGPIDLIVRAPGYLTIHTRAFTDRDDTITLHLVPEAAASTTFGYRAAESSSKSAKQKSPGFPAEKRHLPLPRAKNVP